MFVRFLFLLVLSLINIGNISAITEEEQLQLIETGLPLVVIETVDSEEPAFEAAYAPPGCNGQGIKNATKVPGRMRIANGGLTSYDSGYYEKGVSGITIKVRGNTSTLHPNHSYKIKLQKKDDLLCRGDIRCKDKDWLLLGVTNLNAMIGFKMNEMVGLQWTPGYQYVNLVVNGDYRGIYMLAESVDRNADCRLNVDKNTGYVFELDAYWWNEDLYVESSFPESLNYTFKYPDSDDITEEQLSYFQKHIQEMEASLEDGTYPNYIDVESFAKWMLARDILGDMDGAGANIFLTKYDSTSTSKIVMGPLWDFDGIMCYIGWGAAHNYLSYFRLLFNSDNKIFRKAYLKNWNEIKDSVFVKLYEYSAHFSQSSEGQAFNSSVPYHNGRWQVKSQLKSVETYLANVQSYFTWRKQWLESNMMFEPRVGDSIMVGDAIYRVTSSVPGEVEVISIANKDTVAIANTITTDKWRYTVTGIASDAFANAKAVTSIEIPRTIKSIASGAFSGCTAVTSINCLAWTPPMCASAALDDINKTECILYVPKGFVEDYRYADQWKEFLLIEVGETPDSVRGDVNGDGFINGTDIQTVINLIVAGQYDENADVNTDDVVNGTDIQEIINTIVGAKN